MKNKKMFRWCFPLGFVVIFLLCGSAVHARSVRVLVFCKTAGYHHSSIAEGVIAIEKLGRENHFQVDSTTDATKFTLSNLKHYQAVIFLSTTGDVLDDEEQAAFEAYIRGGGGFVGVHAATDTEYGWPWYGNLVGAYFGAHPAQQVAVLHIVDTKSLATKHLPKEWKRKDEWYNFKWMTADSLHVLITIDESSYNPGKLKMGAYHPMSWYHDYDGGRAFYTELGHTEESYSDPLYLGHLLGGILYATGSKKME